MPRETRTRVSRGDERAPYSAKVGERSVVVPHRVPQTQSLGDAGASQIMSNFFGGIVNAANRIQDVEGLARRAEIIDENKERVERAKAKALAGDELTPEEAQYRDPRLAFIKTKAENAAQADALKWIDGDLSQRDLLGMQSIEQDSAGFIKENLKGLADETYGAYYTQAFRAATKGAVQTHSANLFQQQRLQQRDDISTAMSGRLKTDQIGNVDDLNEIVDRYTSTFGPANAQGARTYAIGKFMELAGMHGKLDRAVSIMKEPDPRDPKGLSWAQKFPEAFDAAWKKAKEGHSQEFLIKRDESAHGVDMALAAGDLNDATKKLFQFGETFGTNSEKFQAMELKVQQQWAKGMEERSATQHLLTVGRGDLADPKLVEKYGAKVLDQVLATKGVLGVVDRVTAWNDIPKAFKDRVESGLTKLDAPEIIATTYDQMAGPLLKQRPDLVNRVGLNDDARFVLRYIESEQALRNTPTPKLALEAAETLKALRASDQKLEDIRLWEQGKEGARDKFYETLRSETIGHLKSRYQGDWIDRLFAEGSVVIPEPLTQEIEDSVRRQYVRFAQAGSSDPRGQAVKAALDGIGPRLVALPNAEGNVHVVKDNSPDAKAVTKWQRQFAPDGTLTFDPNETFRKESREDRLRFLAGGADIGLRPGHATQIDGYMTAVDALNRPLYFVPGQALKFNIPSENPSLTGRAFDEKEVVLSSTPEEFRVQVDDLFKGTGFRFAKVPGVDVYELQYGPNPPPLKTVDELKLDHTLDQIMGTNLGFRGAIRRFAEREGPEGFNAAMAADKALSDKLYGPWTEPIKIDGDTIKNGVNDLVNSLKDKGILPQSLGLTKLLPEFKAVRDAWDWLKAQVQEFKVSKGNFPVEPNDTPVEDRYVTSRRKFIEAQEGRRHRVYDDGKGFATVGIGFNLDAPHVAEALKDIGLDVSAIRKGDVKMTDEQIDEAFERLVIEAEKVVSNRIKRPITAHQRIALVSMAYQNPSLIGPKLTASLNAGDMKAALTEILHFSNGDRSKGIKFRREREALFFGLPLANS